MNQLLTIPEVAALLGQSPGTVARKARQGLIPSVQLPTATGKRPGRRFEEAAIRRMLQTHA